MIHGKGWPSVEGCSGSGLSGCKLFCIAHMIVNDMFCSNAVRLPPEVPNIDRIDQLDSHDDAHVSLRCASRTFILIEARDRPMRSTSSSAMSLPTHCRSALTDRWAMMGRPELRGPSGLLTSIPIPRLLERAYKNVSQRKDPDLRASYHQLQV